MRHIFIFSKPPKHVLAPDLLALPRDRRRHLPLAHRASRHAQELGHLFSIRTVLPIFHQRQQMHVERIERQRAAFASLGCMFE
ncbi:hypothetical protein JM78_12380 [Burkholderia pyrrocinia]|nr:hypothetical protein JM78_12380 [Burkholderia pyrrocinia]